jgi:hypothetical protein
VLRFFNGSQLTYFLDNEKKKNFIPLPDGIRWNVQTEQENVQLPNLYSTSFNA